MRVGISVATKSGDVVLWVDVDVVASDSFGDMVHVALSNNAGDVMHGWTIESEQLTNKAVRS